MSTQGNNKTMGPDNMAAGTEPVFALDIGTRSVVGVVGVQEDSLFRVLGSAVELHSTRSMLDGQIHEIEEVARVIQVVRGRLESQLGIMLQRVSIAAAGRVLKTRSVRISRTLDPDVPVDEELVQALEIEGIGLAQEQLRQEMDTLGEPDLDDYCVGHSVIRSYLNGYTIGNPLGHRGRTLELELLATFLPQIVVDSLHSALERSGLQAASLTLEPIAALHVTIPRDLRLLNLALIDIGAGTSDIAITREGSVVAYAMVPVAGDEITEAISRQFLVSFEVAEKLKLLLSGRRQKMQVTDILGIRRGILRQDIADVVDGQVQRLAEELARTVTAQNAEAPSAVFLVGGGSRIPGLSEALAEALSLDPQRVAVQTRQVLRNVRVDGRELSGPEAVTPLGIAVYSLQDRKRDFMTVVVNGKKARLFRSGRVTVADALIMVGCATDQLIGRNGKSCRIVYNGEELVLRGTSGEPARIGVNGADAHLDTELDEGAQITLQPARSGTDALYRVRDLPGFVTPGTVYLDATQLDLWPVIRINGRLASPDEWVDDGDDVQVTPLMELETFLEMYEVRLSSEELLLNGEPAQPGLVLHHGDRIDRKDGTDGPAMGGSTAEPWQATSPSDRSFAVTVNGESVRLDGSKEEYIFVDVFDHISFDLKKPQGKICLKLNGQIAAYTDPIGEGDAIQVYWEK